MKTLFIALSIFCIFLLGCQVSEDKPELPSEDKTGLPNPASVHCEEQGGKLEMITEPEGGVFGICIFETQEKKTVCEEWDYYEEECDDEELIYCEPVDESKGQRFCYTLYAPVCGFTKSREWQTFSNDCVACVNNAIGYKQGECEVEEK